MKIYNKDLVVCDQSSSTMYFGDCDDDGINFDPDDPDFEPSCQVKTNKKIPLPDFNANHSHLRSSLETRYSNVDVLCNKYLNNGGGTTGKLRRRTPPVLIPTLNRNLSTGILDNRPVLSTREVNMRQAEVENHENNCSSPNSWYSERGVLTLEDIRNQHHNNHNMLTLEELKSHYSSCFTCGVSWNEDHVSLDCFECGGYSMQRPCPICEGKCQRTWNRDVAMSHAMHKAHWEGECGLPASDQEAFIIKTLVETSDECITEALKDLKTSS